jgi:carboxypeptidase C (cathepsin A)
VTFVFNGGPGAAAVWLHLAVGPKRLDVPEDGSAPKAPYRVVDNEYSWLPATDMVFIDPVNTGYSRAATPEQAREFFGVQEDISAVGEFIRLWLTKNQRWGSPVFLAGESYGTTRAAGLSNYLQERVGVSVSGVVLISTVLNFATLSPGENNDMPFALYLPSYAAVAWHHKKVLAPQGLDALLKDAEAFALGDYATALARGAALSEADRQRIAKRVADLTSLPQDYILESNLRIQPARFEKELLRDKTGNGQVIGRFDGRISGWTTDAAGAGQDYDPSLSGFYAAYTSAFNEYARRTLKYDNDLTYEVLSGRTQPWNYSSGGAGGNGGYLYVGDDLRDAMTHNPQLRLLVCSGRFDLATPYFATDYTLNHMTLAPEIRKNITQTYYPGGHMLYHVREGMAKLYQDVTGFVEKK